MVRPVVVALIAAAIGSCTDAAPERRGPVVTCADGEPCRSVVLGGVTLRGHETQLLFHELVTDKPAEFATLAVLEATFAARGLERVPENPRLSPPKPRLCAFGTDDRIVEAIKSELVEGPSQSGSPVCSSSYQARYLFVIRPDGAVTCIENDYAYSCI